LCAAAVKYGRRECKQPHQNGMNLFVISAGRFVGVII
jgi:hypothetical protein